jgi:nitrate/nitrite transporter NarK
VFIVPRVVATHLAHRVTGRALLSAGLFLVCLGLFWLAFVVRTGGYGPLTGGMLLTGIGAALLNGETTKVGMTVIPKERSGMASGVSGTVRFTGLVVGIAALGAVLYSRVTASVTAALPNISNIDRLALVHDITAGKLTGLVIPGYASSKIQELASASFADGYHALFLAGALFMLLATILTWRLVNPADTRGASAPSPKRHEFESEPVE